MTGRHMVRGVIVAALGAWATLIGVVAPAAVAQPCPDVEVVFARGSSEAPGVGGVGQGFVDAVRAQAGARTVGVYAVNYPASDNFVDRIGIVSSVVDGVRDESDHVRAMAANCPNTRLVLSGFSQGAAVSGFVTSAEAPANLPVQSLPQPLPPEVADNVAAVVLFGLPSAEFLGEFGAPAVTIGPLYAPKTLQLCNPGDTICDGAPGGDLSFAHSLYGVNGSVNEGAAYAVGRL